MGTTEARHRAERWAARPLWLTRRSLFKGSSRRHLSQNPVGTLVGTVAIAAKSEDRALLDNLGRVTRRVLISPGIRRGFQLHDKPRTLAMRALLLVGLREERADYWQQEFRAIEAGRTVQQCSPEQIRAKNILAQIFGTLSSVVFRRHSRKT